MNKQLLVHDKATNGTRRVEKESLWLRPAATVEKNEYICFFARLFVILQTN